MSTIHNLASLARINKLGSNGATSLRKSFSLNGSTGYIQQVGYSSGVVSKLNDGTRDYRQCYGGYFNIGDSAVHGLDNRSVQTMKFVGTIDNLLAIKTFSSYTGTSTLYSSTDGKVNFQMQGTGSITVTSTTTLTPGTLYNIIVRINNSLPGGTARVITDADIFISGVKESLSSVTAGTVTTTTSSLLLGASSSTTNLHYGKIYSFSLRNRALSDAECQAEGLSNWAVVTPTGLVNTRDTSNTSQAISRTGYNLNVSGNVLVATDGDGKYIYCNGNKTLSAGTSANATATSSPTLNQTTAFTIKARFKFGGVVPSSLACGIFGRQNIISIYAANASGINQIAFRIRNGATLTDVAYNSAVSTLYDGYLVFDPVAYKMYAYISVSGGTSTLLNPGGTTVAASTFGGTQNFILGDDSLGGGNTGSTPLNVYHARIRARALSQAEINADIALGNNTNNDPTIVASYRPDNLINAQFLSNTSDFTNAAWTKTNTTVTGDFSTAPDGSSTADRLTITGALHNGASQTSTTLTGSSLASKTIISKVFMKVASGTGTARIRLDHTGVDSNQYSGDLTVTTTWQEFTFTRTLTSGTGGTGITTGITTGTAGAALTVEVRNMRTFLVNEILYDNSPNIGGYVGPLSNRYISGWIKPGVDALNDSTGNPIMNLGYGYVYIRDNTNAIRIRYDDRIGAIERSSSLGTGFRNWVHFIGGIEWDGTAFREAIWLNGVLISRFGPTYLDASHVLNPQVQILMGRMSSRYFTGNLRDLRFYTSPTALTNAGAINIANGGEPSGASKVLHRNTNQISGNYVLDQSGNGRVGLMTGGITLVRK